MTPRAENVLGCFALSTTTVPVSLCLLFVSCANAGVGVEWFGALLGTGSAGRKQIKTNAKASKNCNAKPLCDAVWVVFIFGLWIFNFQKFCEHIKIDRPDRVTNKIW